MLQSVQPRIIGHDHRLDNRKASLYRRAQLLEEPEHLMQDLWHPLA